MVLKKFFFSINKYRVLWLIMLGMGISAGALSQNYRDPYSYYGIGELYPKTFTGNLSMGGVSLGWNDLSSFTSMNPASYSNMLTSTFDVGLKGKIQHLVQDNNKYTSTLISFGYFSLGFPISKKIKWAGAFGLLPVSSIGYKNTYSSYNSTDSFTTTETFDHTGGFNQFFAGTSLQPIKNLNIGINVSYFFGNADSRHSIEYSGKTTNLNILESSAKNFGNIYIETGLQYIYNLDTAGIRKITFGAIFTPSQSLNQREKYILQNYISNSSSPYRDSIEKFDKKNGALTMPVTAGIGLIYSNGLKWKLGADYRFEQWSSFTDLNGEKKLNNMSTVSLGGEYLPNLNSIYYFRRIIYRAGLNYTSSFLKINNSNLKSVGFSLGAGFPIVIKEYKRFPFLTNRINFGIAGGKYLNVPSDGIKETYLYIYFGVRFNDLWGQRSKIE